MKFSGNPKIVNTYVIYTPIGTRNELGSDLFGRSMEFNILCFYLV